MIVLRELCDRRLVTILVFFDIDCSSSPLSFKHSTTAYDYTNSIEKEFRAHQKQIEQSKKLNQKYFNHGTVQLVWKKSVD